MLELEHGFRIVDVYTQLPSGDRAGTNRFTHSENRYSPDRLEREMRQAGITKAVVAPPTQPKTSYVASNNGVARHSVDRPFVAVARINGSRRPEETATDRLRTAVSQRVGAPTSPERADHLSTPEDIERYAYDDRFHGFVLDPEVDGYPDDDLLAVLDDVGLPVLVHGQINTLSRLSRALLDRSFPVIVAHFGGHPLDRSQMNEMINLLAEHDDCYVETSFVRYRHELERALLEHPDRVLFGSGTPANHPNVAVMEMLTLDVSEDKLWRVFSKNACRVFDALGPT